ncbi:hypothetical protein VTI74DRAFT_9284 [Chaetomium olivicolor]
MTGSGAIELHDAVDDDSMEQGFLLACPDEDSSDGEGKAVSTGDGAGPGPIFGQKVGEGARALFGNSAGAESGKLFELSQGDRLAQLVSLQTFEGAWKWEWRLLVVLGVEEGVVKQRVAAAGLGGVEDDVLSTALVVVFLEERMKDKKDEWEMVVEKARGWLEGELTKGGNGTGADNFLEGVRNLV